jgi:cyclopropane fatty-acyl-phospholipid synthase-like methyltransferase
VLELGCGMGGNLIPMALGMPKSTFTGFDLSGVQVERAKEMIAALELRNITVTQRRPYVAAWPDVRSTATAVRAQGLAGRVSGLIWL